MDCKSMSKIVEARALVIFRLAQADLARQVIERSTHCGKIQAAAVIVEKKTGRRCAAQEPITASSVIGNDVASGSVEWDQASLAELRLADGENTLAEIHIRLLQLERFTDTQTCHCQQSEQAVVCP